MYEEQITELQNTESKILGILNSFSQEEFNRFPGPEKWSVAQMTDHVLQSVRGFYQMLTGPSKPTERAPDQNVPTLKSIFLDFSKQLKSPDFIVPRQTSYDKTSLIKSLKDKMDAFVEAAMATDLTATCNQTIANLGEMTKLEAVYFVIVHTQRHIHQAEKIREQIKSMAV